MSHLSPDDFVEAATRAADVAKQVLRRQIDFEADFLSGKMNDFRSWFVLLLFQICNFSTIQFAFEMFVLYH